MVRRAAVVVALLVAVRFYSAHVVVGRSRRPARTAVRAAADALVSGMDTRRHRLPTMCWRNSAWTITSIGSTSTPATVPVGLYVGYYASQRQGDTIHSPQNCLPGAGWQPVETRRRRLATRRPHRAGQSVRHSEGTRSAAGLLLVPGARSRRRQRVQEQGAAHARRGATSSDQRRAGAVDRADRHRQRSGEDSRSRRSPSRSFHIWTSICHETVLRRLATCIAAVVLLWAGACTRDPQVKAQKYVASGDAYLAKHQNNRALIEYKRAVQAKPEWAEAHYKLAKAYELRRRCGQRISTSTRARAILICRTRMRRCKAGMLLLAAGEFEAARTRAELALTNASGQRAGEHSARKRAGRIERNRQGGQADRTGDQPGSVVRAGVDGTRCGAVPRRHSRRGGRTPFRKRWTWRRVRWRRVWRSRTFSGRVVISNSGGTHAEDRAGHRQQQQRDTSSARPAVPVDRVESLMRSRISKRSPPNPADRSRSPTTTRARAIAKRR